MTQFSELTLSAPLQNNLARNLFKTPTPVQAEAIPPALKGRDVLATAQTGTGKTLAFAIPVLQKLTADTPVKPGVRALILVPTRELAMQVAEVFAKLTPSTGIYTALVVGGMSEQRQLLQLRKGAQVMVATPGRLIDFLTRRLVRLQDVRTVILDEADRMLDMGFLPAIETILQELPAERQTLFFSATIEKSVAHLIRQHLKDPVRVEIGSMTRPAENVELRLYEVDQNKKADLLEKLLKDESEGSFLVFARTRHGADRLATRLSKSGVDAARIHGDRTQAQRTAALRGFQRGEYRVLVATDVAARGIHVDGISHVVNFDLPQVAEDFIHRVGRTGRLNAKGIATTFATRNERNDIRRIETVIKMRLAKIETPAGLVVEIREPAILDFAAPRKAFVKPFTKPFAKPFASRNTGKAPSRGHSRNAAAYR